jgi:hypothetical protein
MFELQDLKAARLWVMPPMVMEVVLELLCENCLAHPQWPHVFVVLRLMTHLWRKDLMKNGDLLFTVLVQVPFWTSGQFEPLIVAVILPLSHVLVIQDHGWSRELTRGSKQSIPYGRVSKWENQMTKANFMSWTGSCAKCGKIQRAGHGLFCCNFLLG